MRSRTAEKRMDEIEKASIEGLRAWPECFSECCFHEPCVVTGCSPRLAVDPTARVDSFCKIEARGLTVIGARVHVASFCHLGIGGGRLALLEGSAVASGCAIITGSNVPGPGRSCSAVDPSGVIKRSAVVLEKNATLYAHVVVLPGCVIGENAVVAAGSRVDRDIPAYEMWGGDPIKFIRRVHWPELPAEVEHSDSRFVESYIEMVDGGAK